MMSPYQIFILLHLEWKEIELKWKLDFISDTLDLRSITLFAKNSAFIKRTCAPKPNH